MKTEHMLLRRYVIDADWGLLAIVAADSDGVEYVFDSLQDLLEGNLRRFENPDGWPLDADCARDITVGKWVEETLSACGGDEPRD